MPISATTCPTKYAVQIRFGILSAEEVRKLAVCEIDNELIYSRDGMPAPDGINDIRMGTMDLDRRCHTCGCNYNDCPGHFGRISLPKPIFHPGYLATTLKILRCICFSCAKLKLRDDNLRREISRKASARTRFKRTFEACSKLGDCKTGKLTGDGCGYIQPKYTREGLGISMQREGNQPGSSGYGDPKSVLTAEDVLAIFKKISDDDLRLLGMDPGNNRSE